MAEHPAPARRLSSATLALGAAAILAVAAVAIAALRSDDPVASTTEPGNALAAAPSLDESIARLREQLRRDPDDHQNWFMLGLALRDSGRLGEAGQAFRRAMELSPQTADYAAFVGEMMLLEATSRNQEPPEEAARLFRRALELEPDNAPARFYLATLKDDAGDHRGAVEDMLALLRDAPADAIWAQQVRQSVISIARLHDIDIAGRLPPEPQAVQAGATAAIPGPTREQMEAARGIPPSQQDEMVRGMVERLAARLRQNPRDADGWIRLMRSRMVLNDPGAAREALNSGLAAFRNDPATQTRLREAAQQLGVPNG